MTYFTFFFFFVPFCFLESASRVLSFRNDREDEKITLIRKEKYRKREEKKFLTRHSEERREKK